MISDHHYYVDDEKYGNHRMKNKVALFPVLEHAVELCREKVVYKQKKITPKQKSNNKNKSHCHYTFR